MIDIVKVLRDLCDNAYDSDIDKVLRDLHDFYIHDTAGIVKALDAIDKAISLKALDAMEAAIEEIQNLRVQIEAKEKDIERLNHALRTLPFKDENK